jgi:hypothetical protein
LSLSALLLSPLVRACWLTASPDWVSRAIALTAWPWLAASGVSTCSLTGSTEVSVTGSWLMATDVVIKRAAVRMNNFFIMVFFWVNKLMCCLMYDQIYDSKDEGMMKLEGKVFFFNCLPVLIPPCINALLCC